MLNQQGARGFNFLHFLWTNTNAWMIWQSQAWAFFWVYLFANFLVNISHQKTPIFVTTILMWRVVLAQCVNGKEVLQSINLAFTIELYWPTKWVNTNAMPSNFKKILKIFVWILRFLKPKTSLIIHFTKYISNLHFWKEHSIKIDTFQKDELKKIVEMKSSANNGQNFCCQCDQLWFVVLRWPNLFNPWLAHG